MNTILIVGLVVMLLLVIYLIFNSATKTESETDKMIRQLGATNPTEPFGNTVNCDEFEMKSMDDVLANPYCFIKLFYKALFAINLDDLTEADKTTIYNNITDYINSPATVSGPTVSATQIKVDRMTGLFNGIMMGIRYILMNCIIISFIINSNNNDILIAQFVGYYLFAIRMEQIHKNYLKGSTSGYIIYDKPNNLIKINNTGEQTDNCKNLIEEAINNNVNVNIYDGCVVINLSLTKEYIEKSFSSQSLYKFKDNRELLMYMKKDFSDIAIFNLINFNNTTTLSAISNSKMSDKLTTLKTNNLYTTLSDDDKRIIDSVYSNQSTLTG